MSETKTHQFPNKKRGALNGFMLWLLMVIITFVLLIFLSDMLGGMLFFLIVFPAVPLAFILIGYFCWHIKNVRRVFIIVYLLFSILLYTVLLSGIYSSKISRRQGTYFNLKPDKNIIQNEEACYKQFNKSSGKYVRFYLKCDFGEQYHTALNTIANREKGLVGNISTYDCHCEFTRPLWY